MSGLVSIFKREIFDRRDLIITAVIAAFLPPLVALMPRFQTRNVADVRSIVAVIFAAGWALSLIVYLGTSMIGRALVEGRLGFYFSRPFSAAAIWWGKIGAALAVTILLPIIVMMPSYLLNRGAGIWAGLINWQNALSIVFLLTFLLLTIHCLSIILRSRSPWLVCHLVIYFCVAWQVWRSVERVIVLLDGYRNFQQLLGQVILLILMVLCGCLMLAGYIQIARGRADLRRSSSSLAWSISSLLLVIAIFFSLYTEWLRRPQIDDLKSITPWFTKVSESNWLEINGRVERGGTHFHSYFLYNTATGAWLRRDNTIAGLEPAVFSPNGRRLFWLFGWLSNVGKRWNRQQPADLYMFDLESPQPEARLVIPAIVGAGQYAFPYSLAVSDDGARVALMVDNILAVYEIDSGAQICTLRIGTKWRQNTIHFVDRDRLRLYRSEPPTPEGDERILSIYSVSIREKEVEKLAAIEPVTLTGFMAMFWHRSSDRILLAVGEEQEKRWQVHDGRSGEMILASGLIGEKWFSRGMILQDGSMVFGRHQDGRIILEHLTANEGSPDPIDLGQGMNLSLGGEIAPGKMVVARSYSNWNDPAGRILVVDIESGSFQPILSEAGGIIHPAWTLNNWYSNPNRTILEPGSAMTRLFIENEHRVFRFDPETGEQTTLFATEGN